MYALGFKNIKKTLAAPVTETLESPMCHHQSSSSAGTATVTGQQQQLVKDEPEEEPDTRPKTRKTRTKFI